MRPEWRNIVEAFTAGAFPWISQLRRLKIHFEIANLDVAAIFNFFASLFAISIYAYCIYAHPTQVMNLPQWYTFIAVALGLTLTYVAIFIWKREPVTKSAIRWPVHLGFVLYIGIFLTLTAGFGLLRILSDYVVVRGKVVAATTGVPISRADVEIVDADGRRRSTLTDSKGRFVLLIDQPRFDLLSSAIVSKAGYEDEQKTFPDGFSATPALRTIELTPSTTE